MKKEEYISCQKEITDWDEQMYFELTSDQLTDEQREVIHNPSTVYERETSILAIHWHPEQVPIHDVEVRVIKMFPNAMNF